MLKITKTHFFWDTLYIIVITLYVDVDVIVDIDDNDDIDVQGGLWLYIAYKMQMWKFWFFLKLN